MTQTPPLHLATSALLITATALVGLDEWAVTGLNGLLPWVLVAITVILTVQVRPSRQAFVVAALILTGCLIWFVPDWRAVMAKGIRSAGFIAAFFTALSTLRNVAETSPAIAACGTYLSKQPPGRRYAALTSGGQLFALVLNYGAISLLGSLATVSARSEPDARIREIRTRRMLLAIQRGFVASLPWSPLAFCMAITNALIPGATWATSVVPGLVSALILIVTGWAMDTIFKPRFSGPRPAPQKADGTPWLLVPLFTLLLVLGGLVFVLHLATGIRVVGVVLVVVPTVSLGWAVIQHLLTRKDIPLGLRLRGYLRDELPGYRSELILLMMAGYIGTVGAPLLEPIVTGGGLHPEVLPAWVILVFLVWFIPTLGQLGMNPILAVTLIAPSIPDAAAMGTTPTAIVTALAAGWALGGASSPFTATTMLIGHFGGVSAWHVGMRWNGAYTALTGALMTVWVLIFAFWIS